MTPIILIVLILLLGGYHFVPGPWSPPPTGAPAPVGMALYSPMNLLLLVLVVILIVDLLRGGLVL